MVGLGRASPDCTVLAVGVRMSELRNKETKLTRSAPDREPRPFRLNAGVGRTGLAPAAGGGEAPGLRRLCILARDGRLVCDRAD